MSSDRRFAAQFEEMKLEDHGKAGAECISVALVAQKGLDGSKLPGALLLGGLAFGFSVLAGYFGAANKYQNLVRGEDSGRKMHGHINL